MRRPKQPLVRTVSAADNAARATSPVDWLTPFPEVRSRDLQTVPRCGANSCCFVTPLTLALS